MEGVYRFAQQNIELRTIHSAVHDFCAEYRTGAAPDFSVENTEDDIDRERSRAAASDAALGRRARTYTDDYMEELAVYRQIAERLPLYGTVLFHGSALAADGEGYLFAAPSGTGKSTHARLWREMLGDRVLMINDDKPLLHVGPEGVTVYGTPFRGKHALGEPIAAPLRAIGLLSRAERNTVRPVTFGEAYPALLRQVYRPSDGEAMTATLRLLDRLGRSVRLYALECNMEPSAASAAWEAMRG